MMTRVKQEIRRVALQKKLHAEIVKMDLPELRPALAVYEKMRPREQSLLARLPSFVVSKAVRSVRKNPDVRAFRTPAKLLASRITTPRVRQHQLRWVELKKEKQRQIAKWKLKKERKFLTKVGEEMGLKPSKSWFTA